MTRRLFLASTFLLAAPSASLAKAPPASTAVPSAYKLTDLCPVSDAERVAISESGAILLSTATPTTKVAPTRLWVRGKTIPLPANFVGLSFGPVGAVYGYTRNDTGVTRAAVWKAGNVRELLPVEDADNTRAIVASRNETVVLVLSSGECGMITAGARDSSEIGRASVGDVSGEPFHAVAINNSGTVIAGNQGDRAYYYDSGEWQEVLISTDTDSTVLTGMDSAARLMCGYTSTGSPARRQAWIRDLKNNDDVADEQIIILQVLPGASRTAYPNATALALGERGVVGFVSAEATPETGARGVLWRNAKVFDLTARLAPGITGWTIKEARAIGATGSIIALAEQNGQRRIVLLSATR